jgi:dephospho-CoA kinase
VRDAVVGRFGPEVLGADGEVDRALVARRAFAEPEHLRFLERLLHPLVAAEVARWRAEQSAAGARLLVHEVPLLFEAGVAGRYEHVVLITAPDEVRRARSPERWDQRSRHQLPEEAKRAGSHDVYENTGDLDALDAWVGALARRLGA